MTGILKRIAAFLSAVLLTAAGCAARAEQPVLNTVDKAIAYARENRPSEMDLGAVRMRPAELYRIRQQLPEDAVLHFQTTWQGMTISDTDEELNLRSVSYRMSEEEIDQLTELLPGVKKIDVCNRYYPANKVMFSLMEKHPQIEFVWILRLNPGHSVCTADTAYSSFNVPTSKTLVRMTAEDVELLRYVPGLKALDIGHNAVKSLDFLKYFPDLELLILGDNPVTDISMIGTLKHLKYLELFNVPVTDVSPLAGCTELLDLNLSYCKQLTDLSSLDTLTRLERFQAAHMDGVSEEERKRFTAAHPQTDVKFNAQHATSDGWREHERYSHYIQCFKNHSWVPFGQPLPTK